MKEEQVKGCAESYEGTKFIWTNQELKQYNLTKLRADELEPVSKDDNSVKDKYGIRAYQKNPYGTSMWSLLVPWH